MYVMPLFRAKTRYVCGIDPDVTKSGFAVYDVYSREWVELSTMPFGELEAAILKYDKVEIRIIVEAAWKHKGMYKSHRKGFPKDFDTWNTESKLAYMFALGVKVGRNHGVGEMFCQTLRGKGYDVLEWPPTTAKWSNDDLRRYTGLKFRSNEEIRDSVRAAFLNL